jgi:hypothetical protein
MLHSSIYANLRAVSFRRLSGSASSRSAGVCDEPSEGQDQNARESDDAGSLLQPPFDMVRARARGPFCAATTRLVAWTSSASEIVGFWTILTVKPSLRRDR